MEVTASPDNTRVGWIGTGVMGCHMARHVVNAGYVLTVYNRTPAKAQPLIEEGAKLVHTPKEVAVASDVVFTMVAFPSDVRTVIAGSDGLLASLAPGAIVVDLTTSEPSLAAELAALAEREGKYLIDAPVTGGDVGAKNGTLSVMVGGHRPAVERIRPLLDCFAKTITVVGGPGNGQHCKMANQITIAATMVGMCEGLMYAHAAGLDLDDYLSAISGGAASSFCIKSLAPRVVSGDMRPGFYVEHFVKDLGIAVNACQQMNVSLPGLGVAHQLYISLMASGDSRLGTQALIRALERINGKKLPQKGRDEGLS